MRYEGEKRGMSRYIQSSPELRGVLAAVAEVGADAARAAAPVDSGDYAASIHTEDAGVVSPAGLEPRLSYRIVADAEHAAFVELRDHPLQAAIDAIEGPGA